MLLDCVLLIFYYLFYLIVLDIVFFVVSGVRDHLVYVSDSKMSHFEPSHCRDTIPCRKNADK